MFPIKVSANHRYLVGQNDAPVLMGGDSPQAMIGDISEADADFFLANRQTAGYDLDMLGKLASSARGRGGATPPVDIVRLDYARVLDERRVLRAQVTPEEVAHVYRAILLVAENLRAQSRLAYEWRSERPEVRQEQATSSPAAPG